MANRPLGFQQISGRHADGPYMVQSVAYETVFTHHDRFGKVVTMLEESRGVIIKAERYCTVGGLRQRHSAG